MYLQRTEKDSNSPDEKSEKSEDTNMSPLGSQPNAANMTPVSPPNNQTSLLTTGTVYTKYFNIPRFTDTGDSHKLLHRFSKVELYVNPKVSPHLPGLDRNWLYVL